ncbi:MAG: hypothetical protein M2R45_01701 [Verrucomicrobia subdivision 3 bacterium]|nr:hypothetical protein [Limisphaerales bacterium]MCS1413440.1 hypothetical protein [Limisphaerales bacterium]
MFFFNYIEDKFDLRLSRPSRAPEKAEKPVEVEPPPVEEGAVEKAPCCGDLSEEARTRIKQAFEAAWQNLAEASPEILERLPPENAVEEAVAAFSLIKLKINEKRKSLCKFEYWFLWSC